MKKKIQFTSITLLLVLVIGFFAYRTYKIEKIKQTALGNIHKLPKLPFVFDDFSPTDIDGKSVIINYFSPDCEHCRYMISQIIMHKNELNQTHIVMISPVQKSDMLNFRASYGLDSLRFITTGLDTSFIFLKTFGSALIPSFYVYNSGHELDTIFRGEVKIENLINRIK